MQLLLDCHVLGLAHRRQGRALGCLAIEPLGVALLAVVPPRPHVVDEAVTQHEARRIANLQHRLHEGSDGGQDGLALNHGLCRLRVVLGHVGIHDELLAGAAVADPLCMAAAGAPLGRRVLVKVELPVLAGVDLLGRLLSCDSTPVGCLALLMRGVLSLGNEAERTLVAIVAEAEALLAHGIWLKHEVAAGRVAAVHGKCDDLDHFDCVLCVSQADYCARRGLV